MEKTEKKCLICGATATRKIDTGKMVVYYCAECVKPMTEMGFASKPVEPVEKAEK